jgi:tRNA A37 threonylcarbamoyladenosine dehydratase
MDRDAALKLDCGAGLGAATHVTGAFAFAAVARSLEILLKPAPTKAAT